MKKVLLFLACSVATTSLYAYKMQDALRLTAVRDNQVAARWYYHLDNTDEKICSQKYKDDSAQWENFIYHAQGNPFGLIFTAEPDINNPNKCTITCSNSAAEESNCQPFEILSAFMQDYKLIHDKLYNCSIVNGQIVWPFLQELLALNTYYSEQYFWIDHPTISATTKWQGMCGSYDSKSMVNLNE